LPQLIVFGLLDKYIMVLLTGALVSYCLTPVVRGISARLGMVDLPNERRPHKKPTARGGGLAVVLGFHAACLVALVFPWPALAGGLGLQWWRNFVLASSILLVVGLVDDLRGLRPQIKLVGQVASAVLIWLSGARFGSLFGIPLPPLVDAFLVVIWLVAIINAFNLIDGLDGLATGLALISTIGLCGLFVLGHLPGNVLVLLGLAGACLGFLRHNFHPASVFLGDTGSMFLGFVLGVVSLQTFTKNTLLLSLAIPMLVLGVPIYDALLAIWRRSVRLWLASSDPEPGPRRGIMQPDLEHLHHRLVKSGLSTGKTATALCAMNAAFVVFGLLLTIFQSRAMGIFLLALMVVVFVLLRHLAVIELRDTGQALLTGLRRPTHATFKALLYPVWDMAWMAGALAIAMWAVDERRAGFWNRWFLDLPVWVTPTFLLLAISRAYVTVWTRARPRDVLALALTLVTGLLLSLAIALVIDPLKAPTWWLRALIIGGISPPMILVSRVTYRFTEEIVAGLRADSDRDSIAGRVVLYGAGGRCQLFLRERGFSNSSSFDSRVIVGLVDDDASLHNQWVHGYRVLGGLKDLPQMISRHRITGVVITTALRPESMALLQEMAQQQGLGLSEWGFEERELRPGVASERKTTDTAA
jgi:UDP-GlcNAc:undecaprenyl-phosphate GlcNAc-1-phosphate transferase